MKKIAIILMLILFALPIAHAAQERAVGGSKANSEPASSGKWREKSLYESIRTGWNTFLDFLVGVAESDKKPSKK